MNFNEVKNNCMPNNNLFIDIIIYMNSCVYIVIDLSSCVHTLFSLSINTCMKEIEGREEETQRWEYFDVSVSEYDHITDIQK